MLRKLDKKLKAIYNQYKDQKKSTSTKNTIKKYLELEGIPLDEEE